MQVPAREIQAVRRLTLQPSPTRCVNQSNPNSSFGSNWPRFHKNIGCPTSSIRNAFIYRFRFLYCPTATHRRLPTYKKGVVRTIVLQPARALEPAYVSPIAYLQSAIAKMRIGCLQVSVEALKPDPSLYAFADRI